jgi:hypothetical protein
MILPKGVPTLQHMVTKRYSRPDDVFSTPGLQDLVIKCEVDSASRPISTDHFPITTCILLLQKRINSPPSFNFRETDWDEYREKLTPRLQRTPRVRGVYPCQSLRTLDRPLIADAEQLNEAIGNLTQALQETTMEVVKHSKPRPDAKRWWNRELIKMRKGLNRLRSESYRFRAIADHPSHSE